MLSEYEATKMQHDMQREPFVVARAVLRCAAALAFLALLAVIAASPMPDEAPVEAAGASVAGAGYAVTQPPPQ